MPSDSTDDLSGRLDSLEALVRDLAEVVDELSRNLAVIIETAQGCTPKSAPRGQDFEPR